MIFIPKTDTISLTSMNNVKKITPVQSENMPEVRSLSKQSSSHQYFMLIIS